MVRSLPFATIARTPRSLIIAIAVLVALSVAGGPRAPIASAQSFTRTVATMYVDGSFAGASLTLAQERPEPIADLGLTPIGRNRLSSVRASGNGVSLYSGLNFTGLCQHKKSDDTWLGDDPIGDDNVESVQLGNTCNRDVLLCEHADRGGKCEVVKGDRGDLRGSEVGNDTVSSISVPSGVTISVFSDVWYGGRCQSFQQSVSNLAGGGNVQPSYIGNDAISSIRFGYHCHDWNLTHATVVAGNSSDVSCPEGFTKNPRDLNEGAGGKFIYLCTMSGYDPPLYVLTDTEHSDSVEGARCTNGGVKGNIDLNWGAGGKYIYLCVGTETWAWLRPITDVAVHTSATIFGAETCPSGWERATADLNDGAGGKYVWLCVKRR